MKEELRSYLFAKDTEIKTIALPIIIRTFIVSPSRTHPRKTATTGVIRTIRDIRVT